MLIQYDIHALKFTISEKNGWTGAKILAKV